MGIKYKKAKKRENKTKRTYELTKSGNGPKIREIIAKKDERKRNWADTEE